MFHAFEGPEGKRLVMAMKALEDKIVARVEQSLITMRQDIKQTNTKTEAQSWMQKDLSQRMEDLNTEAMDSRTDLLQRLEEISLEAYESRCDLLTRTDEISSEALEARVDCMASLEELEQKIMSGASAVSQLSETNLL